MQGPPEIIMPSPLTVDGRCIKLISQKFAEINFKCQECQTHMRTITGDANFVMADPTKFLWSNSTVSFKSHCLMMQQIRS